MFVWRGADSGARRLDRVVTQPAEYMYKAVDACRYFCRIVLWWPNLTYLEDYRLLSEYGNGIRKIRKISHTC